METAQIMENVVKWSVVSTVFPPVNHHYFVKYL